MADYLFVAMADYAFGSNPPELGVYGRIRKYGDW
jgi:hypothetical protein